ncbi:hypothetical protein ACJX0J_021332, partial [Zea mays]
GDENAETENLEDDANDSVPDLKSLDLDSLVVDCNASSVDIDNEITIIHNFIRDKFKLKDPLLESCVHYPIDYARVVWKIGNDMDLTLDLKHPTELLTLMPTKKMILEFLKGRMGYVARNLAAIVGSAVASKPSRAAVLVVWEHWPKCPLTNLSGFSTASVQSRIGYLEQTEVLFESTPPSLRFQSSRLIAAKSTLATRIDYDPTRTVVQNLLEEISKKIENWQQLPPARLPKPIPIPDFMPKKKRGTNTMKLVNRMKFSMPEESTLGDGLGKGYGLLGQAGSGKLRVSAGQSKLSTKIAKILGLTSSLAFSPVQ